MKSFPILFLWFLLGCAAQPPSPVLTPPTFPTVMNPTVTIPATPTPFSTPTATNTQLSQPTDDASSRKLPNPTRARDDASQPTTRPTNQPTSQPSNQPIPQPSDPILVGAGDIAVCSAKGDEATAQLLDNIDGIVFTLGDNVYPNGSPEQFRDCYAPSWGRHRARTYPAPGNHDYNTGGAKGYYDLFGARAGEPDKGYYSYNVGAWHIIVLNSEIETGEDSAQVQWLRDDLAQHPAKCTLAMFHRPLFSSGPHGRDGSGEKTRALWDVLYEYNADVILNGHDHDYERFAPQDPHGNADAARGIRQFVVGTGGAAPYPFGEIKPNSEARRTGHLGVMKLTLHATSFSWEFIPVMGALFGDSGQGECH